jgi:hypothetical protein
MSHLRLVASPHCRVSAVGGRRTSPPPEHFLTLVFDIGELVCYRPPFGGRISGTAAVLADVSGRCPMVTRWIASCAAPAGRAEGESA